MLSGGWKREHKMKPGSVGAVSLEEFLCRHATQFFAASLRKPGSFGPETFALPPGLVLYIARSTKRIASSS